MTTETLTGARIRARRAAEDEALRAEQRELAAGARAERAEQVAALPSVPFEPPPTIEPGERYVMTTEPVWAYDDRDDRIYLAAVPGQWLREAYARALGIDRDGVVLAQVPTGRVTRVGGGA